MSHYIFITHKFPVACLRMSKILRIDKTSKQINRSNFTPSIRTTLFAFLIQQIRFPIIQKYIEHCHWLLVLIVLYVCKYCVILVLCMLAKLIALLQKIDRNLFICLRFSIGYSDVFRCR